MEGTEWGNRKHITLDKGTHLHNGGPKAASLTLYHRSADAKAALHLLGLHSHNKDNFAMRESNMYYPTSIVLQKLRIVSRMGPTQRNPSGQVREMT